MDKYAKVEDLEQAFNFLTNEFGYSILEKQDSNLGPVLVYIKDELRISLYFDYRDYFFSFSLIKGENTLYPNDNDCKNIKTFWDLASYYNPNFDLNKLNPNEKTGYSEALKLNAELLLKYGRNILIGKEWPE
jgi:hypothetical protein